MSVSALQSTDYMLQDDDPTPCHMYPCIRTYNRITAVNVVKGLTLKFICVIAPSTGNDDEFMN